LIRQYYCTSKQVLGQKQLQVDVELSSSFWVHIHRGLFEQTSSFSRVFNIFKTHTLRCQLTVAVSFVLLFSSSLVSFSLFFFALTVLAHGIHTLYTIDMMGMEMGNRALGAIRR
jgi:hypothetical protein